MTLYNENMLVILDTSAIISVLVSDDKSYARDILSLLKRKVITLVTTEDIFIELKKTTKSEKIKQLTRYKPAKIGSFIPWYMYNASFITVPSSVTLHQNSRDPNDDKYLVLAQVSKADYLITLDKDLLTLKNVSKTMIVTPETFVQLEKEMF